jgi:hypothetical protein
VNVRASARSGLLVATVLLAALAAACGSSSGSTPSTIVETPEEAAQLVIAGDPRFDGIGPQDPQVIGACCFWVAQAIGDEFEVVVEIGWGDCPAGCTERHRWRYSVSRSGAVALLGEEGPPLPGGLPGGGDGIGGIVPGPSGIVGAAVAGPTCPVVTQDDPDCADRPVAGATILVLDAAGTEVARVATAEDGSFEVALPPGDYTIEPQPVEGYMGTAGAMAVTVVADGATVVQLAYDTGIR